MAYILVSQSLNRYKYVRSFSALEIDDRRVCRLHPSFPSAPPARASRMKVRLSLCYLHPTERPPSGLIQGVRQDSANSDIRCSLTPVNQAPQQNYAVVWELLFS